MVSRRTLLSYSTSFAAVGMLGSIKHLGAQPASSSIKLSVMTDEISQDFGKAVEIAAKEFGLHTVELRELWNKSLAKLDDKELNEARRILDSYHLKVSCIASPLFKIDWPGAPVSSHSPNRGSAKPAVSLADHDQLLERYMEICLRFDTHLLRCFDFWRLEDPGRYRKDIDEKIADAARKVGQKKMILALENEYACNTGSTSEAVRILKAIPLSSFKLLWDPGNSMFAGESPFPDAFQSLPQDRIAHVHCKDALQNDQGKWQWAAVGAGKIDFIGLFKALAKGGYHGALSLETHWRGGGTPEESTRKSMQGLKEVLQKSGVEWS